VAETNALALDVARRRVLDEVAKARRKD